MIRFLRYLPLVLTGVRALQRRRQKRRAGVSQQGSDPRLP